MYIAVLFGGYSSEREISINSGNQINKSLIELGYKTKLIDLKCDLKDLLSNLLNPKPDLVFNALHGYCGEDGVIQGFLEVLGIPYTHSGVLASAIGMNKAISRNIFSQNGLLVPKFKIFYEIPNETCFLNLKISYPFIIKPNSEGSSHGVKIIRNNNEYKELLNSWIYKGEVIIEEYLVGKEVQVAVIGDKALGAIEIQTNADFYDYESKYVLGKSKHIMPALLSSDDYEKVLNYALKAHRILGCKGITRSDFIYSYKKKDFFILEINTQPGMTKLSLVPEIASYNGISFNELIFWIVKDAIKFKS